MNKSDLLEQLGKEFEYLPSRETEKILEKIFNLFGDSLASGRRIEIRGFGTFSVKKMKGRVGRNPKTGESINIEPKKTLLFKPSKELKRIINRG